MLVVRCSFCAGFGRQLSVFASLSVVLVDREESLVFGEVRPRELTGVDGVLELSPPEELDETDLRLILFHIPIFKAFCVSAGEACT